MGSIFHPSSKRKQLNSGGGILPLRTWKWERQDNHMEQQLEPTLSKQTLWLDEDGEDDEEELGVGLLARHSRHPTKGVGTTPASSSSGELEPVPASASTNVTTSEHSDQEEEEEEATADDSLRNEGVGGENEENKSVKGEGDGSGNSVYFDRLQGIWKCRHCNWTHPIGSPCILDFQNPKGYLHMAMDTKTLNQWGPCFTLENKGTESINGISEMQSEIPKILSLETNHQLVKNVEDQNIFGLNPAPVDQLHEETNTSSKHFNNATKADVNANLIGEIEEDLMELDVERVLEKQNTHDLYCPNCNSCITRRVILSRRKPKISNIRHKPKSVKKLDPIPNFVADGRSGDTPEIYSNVSPTLTTDEQNNGTEQEREQEAFSCSSCFSLFIPIGNGCFKIFRFFRHGRQTEHTRRLEEICQRENTQSPQEINTSGNIQSPKEMSQKEKTQSPQGISLNETTETSQKVSRNEDTQSPSKVSHNEDTHIPQKGSPDEDMHSPQHISHNEDAQSPQQISRNEDTQNPQNISHNEDTQSPQKISCNENAQSPHNINQNENKQSPQKIPRAKTNWIFSVFGFHKGKATVEKVQSDAVTSLAVTIGEHVDGAAIKPKEPGISNIFSSTDSSLPDKVKAVSREKPDADMLQRNAGENEIIDDIEAGLLVPPFYPRTEVTPSSQNRTQNEHRGADAGEAHEWEILKSIVYGGLVESITSLGVVSSAAGAGADTLNVLALGMANLIGGLLVISHNLRELKNDQPLGASTEINIEEDRYQAMLGRRQNFVLHVTLAILSFLIFGLVPPVVYGFSFRKSDDKDLKLAAAAGASLMCIILLALGKGHVRKPQRTYFRTVSYYVFLGVSASGISFVVGELIKKFLEKLGLFELSSAISVPFLEAIPLEVGRASY